MQASKVSRLVLALGALALIACQKPIFVRAPVLYPAAVPVRAFPSIVVAGGALPEGDLGAHLADYLAKDGQHTVRHVEVKDLEAMHLSGAFHAFSLVVLVEPGLYNDAQEQWQEQPVSTCNMFYGCSTQYQNVYGSTPYVGGEVKLTIYEGPTATPLQTINLDAWASGQNSPSTRKQVVDLLARKLEHAVDVLKSETHVELEPVHEHPIVKSALEHIRKGEWEQGRTLLETAAHELGGLKHRVQARVWYDLAIARWYAPGPDGLTEPAYEAAKRALVWAHKLDGSDRYQSSLAGLERARQRARVLDEQRAAAKHNYALIGAMPAPQ
ncbi:MAG: hypothetical protein JWN04_6019 [Myxococcaceae bacterium]|nr:hypothetical protein [Myxococcaceae bacterium]